MTKTIQILTAFLMLLIAIASFILSYHSLYHIAQVYRAVDDNWLWLWPLLLDVGMAAFALVVVTNRLNGESVTYAWWLVVSYTLVTVIFNVLSIEPFSAVGAVIAASKPLTFFFLFHLLMGMLEQYARRREALVSLTDLRGRIKAKQGEEIDLQNHLIDLQGRIETKQDELKELQSDIQTVRWLHVNDATLNEAKRFLAERPDLTGSELGRLLHKSDSFGRRVKRMLETEISLNGKEH